MNGEQNNEAKQSKLSDPDPINSPTVQSEIAIATGLEGEMVSTFLARRLYDVLEKSQLVDPPAEVKTLRVLRA